MLKNILGPALGLLLFALPVLASADTLTDTMDRTRFLLFRVAAAQVHFDASKPNCVLTVSAQKVRVHEQFILAWGAWGTDTEVGKNKWPPTGAYVIAWDAPGRYKYAFSFYGASGAKTTCSATITVE